eukprot:CAMPEP_0170113360 /NCGR_PEP_ID=MMETSP0020_2-20130122/9833_1 /TAXON_ID=98059 /ORGANISM="Dinobryon sp., Strain UTEXLB2267" /LENGTH=81 /DNA_ID=CAMNT_0010339683 /DNA_START=323 /DNA_END=568 /DNA_ORIENTATION=+
MARLCGDERNKNEKQKVALLSTNVLLFNSHERYLEHSEQIKYSAQNNNHLLETDEDCISDTYSYCEDSIDKNKEFDGFVFL